MRREILKNNPVTTTLDGSIDGSQTTIDVIDGSVFPPLGEFRILIESEVMLATSRTGDTLTVVRGVEDTSAASHGDGADVVIPVTAGALDRVGRDNVPNWGASPPFRIVDTNDETLAAADFAWVNQDGSSVADQNGGILLTRPTQGGGDHGSLLVRSAPATPYSVTAGFLPTYVVGSAFVAGIVLRESGTGKFIRLGWLDVGNGLPGVRVSNYTNPTTADSSPTFILATYPSQIVWLKVTDDGTNLSYFVSSDGLNWVKCYTGGRTVFLSGGPDQIGVTIDAVNSADNSYAALVHWNEAA